MPNKNAKEWNVRTWIEEIEAAGELLSVSGADREEEIGGIVDIFMRKMTNPAVLFDEIPGYDKGYRVLANILTSVRRINIALGLPVDTPEIELVQFWRKHMADMTSIPPKTVNGGPILENLTQGEEVDILKIPSPKWHEGDGGYYIGTACMVVMKDPDSDWINLGCYRVQAHDSRVASVMTSKGKHGNQILAKYRERGEPSAVRQLEENPKVVILFRNPSQNVGWKFRCTAAVYRDGPVFQRVMDRLVAEGLLRDADGTGTAVVLRVDQILTLYGEVLQERVPNLNW